MKNLDLNGLGVQEMNAEEMNGVNGGTWKMFGRNDLDASDGTDCGAYTVNFLWIPIAIGYRDCQN